MNTLKNGAFNRRNFLRGLGVSMALPAFESLLPRTLASATAKGFATTPSGAPLRMAFVYFPNGAIQKDWWPAVGKTGGETDFALGRSMTPLEPLRQKLQIYSGLDHIHATAGPDGAGDHARANGTFLTGVRVKKTAGADIHAGVSIDQMVASQAGSTTRFASLELTCDAVRRSGNCDSGYSCAYQHNLAWRSPTQPMSPEPNPRLVFERLFGAGSPGERRQNIERRQAQQRSILDFIMEDARSLERQMGARDQQKLDEYLTSVREIEKRIDSAEESRDLPNPAVETPPGIPASFQEHMQLMYSMMALAFQTDSTRISTFLLAGDGNNRPFPEIGIAEGHHHLTHHQNDAEMIEKVARIDQWYLQQFAGFLKKLDETKDLDGSSILDNSMIIYGCGNADGNRHTHANLPVILAGRGGGALNAGRFVQAGGVPMSNLLLTLAGRMGVSGLDRFGDSTGPLGNV